MLTGYFCSLCIKFKEEVMLIVAFNFWACICVHSKRWFCEMIKMFILMLFSHAHSNFVLKTLLLFCENVYCWEHFRHTSKIETLKLEKHTSSYWFMCNYDPKDHRGSNEIQLLLWDSSSISRYQISNEAESSFCKFVL